MSRRTLSGQPDNRMHGEIFVRAPCPAIATKDNPDGTTRDKPLRDISTVDCLIGISRTNTDSQWNPV